MPLITTERLTLLPLSAPQLERYLEQPAELSQQLQLPLSRAVVTPRVRRAIRMKLERMRSVDVSQHAWYTYWLVVISEAQFGAGLVGFKGFPDERGEAEIGYGIDPAYGRQGYTTEAVRALIAWAFAEPTCRAVVARGTMKSNTASLRVLAKVGMGVYEENEETVNLRIDRLRINQGDVYWVQLEDPSGTASGIPHPHVVVQDNHLNHSDIDTVVTCAMTSNVKRASWPGNVRLEPGEANLPRASVVDVSTASTVEKARLGQFIGALSSERVRQVLAGMRLLRSSYYTR